MRLILLLVCVVVAYSVPLNEEYKSYKGYMVIEVVPKTQDQVDSLHDISSDSELDFWTKWRKPGLPVRIMLPPNKIGRTIESIEDNGMDFKILNHDVGVHVEAEMIRMKQRAAAGMVFDINDFNTYNDIMLEMDAMAGRCHVSLTCTVETLGNSEEGKAIKVLRISNGTAGSGIWMDSMIHAREWLGPATVLKIMDHFTRDYGIDPDVTNLINSYDWHFVPIMNPDGYYYCWNYDRFWIKSRNFIVGSDCLGTDLNSNYDFHWGSDSSDYSCADNYRGQGPASEPETQAIQTELVRIGSTLRALVSVQTPAQMWLHSWGHTDSEVCARSADHDDLYRVVTAAADATQNTYGTTWTRGTICETVEPASGGTIDFAHGLAGVNYTYSIDLRGPSFITDPPEIELSYQEFYNGLKAMVDEMSPATPK